MAASVQKKRIDPVHGQVAAESPTALKALGNEALNAGDSRRACHMYTLGLDLALDGRAAHTLTAAEWFTLEASSGEVSALLSNRSLAHLRQDDAAAAVEDAEWCVLANPGWSKGHLRLAEALAAAKAGSAARLAVLRRGARACPVSAQLRDGLARAEAQAELDEMARRGAAQAHGGAAAG